jgi:hypothetical protein
VQNHVRKKSYMPVVVNTEDGFPVFQFLWHQQYDCSSPIADCFVINCLTKSAPRAGALLLRKNQLESQSSSLFIRTASNSPRQYFYTISLVNCSALWWDEFEVKNTSYMKTLISVGFTSDSVMRASLCL